VWGARAAGSAPLGGVPTWIRYRGRFAAIATARRSWLAPAIERLPDGHPDKRFVAFMVLYAMDVKRGDLPGPFSQVEAEAFASEVILVGTPQSGPPAPPPISDAVDSAPQRPIRRRLQDP
jgi:hypothetical protein